MTLFIFILGISTVAISLIVSVKFNTYKKTLNNRNAENLSKAICYQLIGEAVIGAGTLLFSAGAHFGWLDNWSMFTQSFIRFVMFFATATTTYHLYVTIRNFE